MAVLQQETRLVRLDAEAFFQLVVILGAAEEGSATFDKFYALLPFCLLAALHQFHEKIAIAP